LATAQRRLAGTVKFTGSELALLDQPVCTRRRSAHDRLHVPVAACADDDLPGVARETLKASADLLIVG